MKIAHVTLYPPKGEKHVSSSGVASYSKNLVTNIPATHDAQVVVCNTVRRHNDRYNEDDVAVHRVFERRPGFLRAVHRELKKTNADVVHIQQELALYGGIFTAYLLQWLVFLWRKKTVITLHGVVDPKNIDARFVKENNSNLPVWLVKIAFRVIYTPLMKWSQKIIVHEQYFKDIIVASYNIDKKKVVVIPHGVESLMAADKRDSRQALGLPLDADVALFMGYATGYKGIDLLIDGFAAYARKNPKAFLIIGAGKHPKLHDDEKYLAEYDRLQRKAASSIPAGQYKWEGFIREDEITKYYSASDVSLYPYTTALSSSGPMSFAIGYERPFLVSSAFADIFGKYPQLLFDRQSEGLAEKLDYFFAHRDEYAQVSSDMKRQRNWKNVGERTLQVYKNLNDKSFVV